MSRCCPSLLWMLVGLLLEIRMQQVSSITALLGIFAVSLSTTTRQPDVDVVVIGGGIVGLSTGVGLAQSGVTKFCIYEKASALRPIGALLGLFPNGVTALKSISPEVADRVISCCIPYKGIHQMDMRGVDNFTFVPNNAGSGLFLAWYLLQKHLVEALPDNVLKLGKVFESYTVDNHGFVSVAIRDRQTERVSNITCRVLIGADGIQSKVRTELLEGKESELHYHDRIMYRALINMDEVNEKVLPPQGITVSYRCGEIGKVFAFRETAKGILTFTATVMMKNEPNVGGTAEMKKTRLKKFFATYPQHVQHLLDHVNASSIYENAIYDVDVMKKWSKGPVVVLGDAAHAMTPILGQGANIGLEDACELSHALSPVLLGKSTKSISETLQEFWKHRMERVMEVHRISREQATYKNTQTNTAVNTVGSFRERNKEFYNRLYGWLPEFDKS